MRDNPSSRPRDVRVVRPVGFCVAFLLVLFGGVFLVLLFTSSLFVVFFRRVVGGGLVGVDAKGYWETRCFLDE